MGISTTVMVIRKDEETAEALVKIVSSSSSSTPSSTGTDSSGLMAPAPGIVAGDGPGADAMPSATTVAALRHSLSRSCSRS